MRRGCARENDFGDWPLARCQDKKRDATCIDTRLSVVVRLDLWTRRRDFDRLASKP